MSWEPAAVVGAVVWLAVFGAIWVRTLRASWRLVSAVRRDWDRHADTACQFTREETLP